MGGVVSPRASRLCAAAMVILAVAGCGPAASASPAEAPVGATNAESTPARTTEAGSLVLVGRIVTMDEPPVAEAALHRERDRGRGRHPG